MSLCTVPVCSSSVVNLEVYLQTCTVQIQFTNLVYVSRSPMCVCVCACPLLMPVCLDNVHLELFTCSGTLTSGLPALRNAYPIQPYCS